ncbi:MAG: porin [Betaproteobacteria bacterium]|nr:porin [Betaproteobacteria bacterium]
MKKSLVALATLAATGAVMAQATIYGRTDIGYGIKATQLGNGGTGVKQLGVMDGGNAGNRIGFRGTEDLGGGMKAHFVVEQGISPTNAALFGVRTGTIGAQYDGYAAASGNDPGSAGGYTQGTNRQTYVALEGDFGTVRVGYQYTSLYEVATLSGFTQTSEGMAGGSIAHLWGNGVAGGTRANGIRYIAVDMGSTTGREQTEFVGAVNTADGRSLNKAARTGLHIDYNAGPLRAAFAYTTLDQMLNAQGNNNAAGIGAATANSVLNQFNVYGALTNIAGTAGTTNVGTQTNLSQLAGSYDFGMIKVGATINSGQSTATTTTVATSAVTQAVTNISSRAVSFDMPMGAMNLVGGFNNASTDVGGVAATDWASSQFGLKYNFSKRTLMYGYTGTSTNNLATGTTLKVITGTLIGIDHQF